MNSVPPEMRESWLVQRLTRPQPTTIFGDNPFSFGGGLRNGGLSSDAMGLLRGLFGFDYMGAAEFEYGAVPEALKGIAADAKTLTAFRMSISLATVPPNWRVKDDTPPQGDATVYVICRKGQAKKVRGRILAWAKGKGRTKERVGLDAALRPHHDWDTKVAGWLELNNGFMFFTDEAMWAGTAELFGVKVDLPSSAVA